MKNKIIALTMALMLSIMSVFVGSFKVKAASISDVITYSTFIEKLFDSNGGWKGFANIDLTGGRVVRDLIRNYVGVFLSDRQADWVYNQMNNLLGSDADEFLTDNLTYSDGDMILTADGKRALRKIASKSMNDNAHMVTYRSLVLNDNALNFGGELFGSQLSALIDFLNRYKEDYYFFGELKDVDDNEDYESFLNFSDSSKIYLVPKNSIFYGKNTFVGNWSYMLYLYDSNSHVDFTTFGFKSYSEPDVINYVKYITVSDILQSTHLENDFIFSQAELTLYYPYNSDYGALNLPKAFNNGVLPYIDIFWGSDSYLKNPRIFFSFNEQEIINVYDSKTYYLASIYQPPEYYVSDNYYNSDYSSNDNSVVNSTVYNNTPTYENITNYYNTYYDTNGTYPTSETIYNYINNYYYGDNGGGSGGSGGSGGGIFDWLGDLGEVLGSLISGLGNLVVNLLSGLTSVFDNIANVLPESMSTFFSTLFSWLPEEWITLITLSMYLGIVYGLVKLIRG